MQLISLSVKSLRQVASLILNSVDSQLRWAIGLAGKIYRLLIQLCVGKSKTKFKTSSKLTIDKVTYR
jgi:hypothetical protein